MGGQVEENAVTVEPIGVLPRSADNPAILRGVPRDPKIAWPNSSSQHYADWSGHGTAAIEKVRHWRDP